MSDRNSRRDRVTSIDGTEPETELSVDQLFHVLSDERRRHLLAYLHGRNGDVVSVVDLVDVLVVRGANSVADLDTDDVAASLHHTHLPKLADVGLIEYDIQNRTVRYHGNEKVSFCLERFSHPQRTSHT